MSRLAHLFELKNRTALVTGGNAGIGLALARALGLAGAAGAVTALLQAYGVTTEYFSLNRSPGGTFGNRNFMAHPRTDREFEIYRQAHGYKKGWVWHALRQQAETFGGAR